MRKILLLAAGFFVFQLVLADSQAELAKKLSNPVAALISVPIEYIVDKNIGSEEQGELTQYKLSPVLPFSLNEDWNVISRTIVSFVDQDNIPGAGMSESGVSDIVQSVFFSPKAPTASGWIWGVGGVFLLDTASDDKLGAGKWGVGPTIVALKQTGPWSYGLLSHYLSDVSGDDDRADVEQFFLQPFLSYTLSRTKTSFYLQAESTRDIEAGETGTVAIFQLGQMFKVGSQIMQARIGVRHWLDSTEFGAEGTAFTAKLTFLFPK